MPRSGYSMSSNTMPLYIVAILAFCANLAIVEAHRLPPDLLLQDLQPMDGGGRQLLQQRQRRHQQNGYHHRYQHDNNDNNNYDDDDDDEGENGNRIPSVSTSSVSSVNLKLLCSNGRKQANCVDSAIPKQTLINLLLQIKTQLNDQPARITPEKRRHDGLSGFYSNW